MKNRNKDFLYKKRFYRIVGTLIAAAAVWSDFRISLLFPAKARDAVLFVLLVLSVLTLVHEAYSRRGRSRVRHGESAAWLSGLYAIFLMYQLGTMLVTDILWLVTRRAVRGASWHRILDGISVVLGLWITDRGRRHARALKTVSYSVPVRLWEPGRTYRIVQLSDLHIGPVIGKQYISRVVSRVNELHPDIVLITGDIYNHVTADEAKDQNAILEELAGIQARDGVYAVRGNHDPDEDSREWQDFLRISHVRGLDNRCASTDEISLVGRTGLAGDPDRIPLSVLMEGCEPAKPVVVLDHDPVGIKEACRDNADLVLCGHTHAGQFFPCTWFVRFWYGKRRYYGIDRVNNTTSIVSAGTGYFQLPVRVGTDSEIVCIDLQGVWSGSEETPAEPAE